jgi:hypothetical protein
MELAIAVIASGLLLAAILLGLERLRSGLRGRLAAGGRAPRPGDRSCILCSSVLGPGERIKSDISPAGAADRIMRIFGCAHCWPPGVSSPGAAVPRACPVCGGALEGEDFAIARYFERAGAPARGHIHVLGCNRCRGYPKGE